MISAPMQNGEVKKMRIDLPYCGFKNCQYWFDGNCTKPSGQEKCEYWYVLHEEPERKTGKWIWDNKTVFERCRCSECGYFRQLKIPEPDCFCPNCGSDMRGEEDA